MAYLLATWFPGAPVFFMAMAGLIILVSRKATNWGQVSGKGWFDEKKNRKVNNIIGYSCFAIALVFYIMQFFKD